jgi:DNA invertase Pin-like site-specific DNA recombinase
MSSSQQDKSIPQQRAEMLPRCKLEGVQIVREFKDEGISGGGMAKRDDFLSMLAFCEERRRAGEPIDAIVCYHTNRFSRADSNERAAYIWQLRQAGVNRLLTSERWFDFRKAEDRTMINLGQDFGNHPFLINLSQSVLRGKKAAAEAGCFTGGMVPYAFDRVIIDAAGTVVRRIPRGEKVTMRAKGWREVLVPFPADDPDPARQQERQTVLWLYETFVRENISYRTLAELLNRRGVPGPGSYYHRQKTLRGQFYWTCRAVKGILRNPAAYRGIARVGATGKGRYHRLVKGEVTPVEIGARRDENQDGAITRPLAFGGLVEPALWDAAQQKAEGRATQHTFARGGGYGLPGGVLHCGHCGGRMHGCTTRPKRGTKVYEYRKYTCSTPKTKPGTCRDYAVHEDAILDLLVEKLESVYLSTERLEGLRGALKAKLEAKLERAPGQAERLEQRLTELDRDIRQGALNVLRAGDNIDVVSEELTRLRGQRDRLAKELQALERTQAVPATETADRVDAAVQRLFDLRKQLAEAKAQWRAEQKARPKGGVKSEKALPDGREETVRRRLGEVIRLLVSRVDVYFEPVDGEKRNRYRFVKGVVKMRPLLSVQGFEPHGR